MERINCGVSGTKSLPKTHQLSELPVEQFLSTALQDFYGTDWPLRPAQEVAIFEYKLLSLSENVLLCTPTNSGKSLLAYLLAFREALKSNKAILIEPLRALAQEKKDELAGLSRLIKKHGGPKVKVTITTGDYRLQGEFMGDKPGDEGKPGKRYVGEIVVATPERLDAISRVPEYQQWFEDVTMVCVDETHLLGDSHRGATLELLITYLRTLNHNPQLVLLSATIANSDDLASWLAPCAVIKDVPRYPVLEKWLYCVDDGDNVNEYVIEEVHRVLSQDYTSVLIFVYRTDAAESLAHTIATSFNGTRIKKGDLKAVMDAGVAWFHANMSAGSKNAVRQALLEGSVRVVVSTTALAMGINLPTTHVFVRDITYTGVRELDVGELTQMMGRAGRGDRPGVGVVFHRPSDKISPSVLESGLKNEVYPYIVSQLSPLEDEGFYGRRKGIDPYYLDRSGNQLMGILNRMGPITVGDLEHFLSLSWGGREFLYQLDGLLRKLCQWKLVFYWEETGKYDLTRLGKTSSRCYLPPATAASIGQLVRDMLYDESDGGHLVQTSPIDLLIVLCLASMELKPLARYSKSLEERVANYMEGLPLSEKSYLYRKWIAGDAAALIGSARIDASFNESSAHKTAYQCTHLAMFLYDLSKGAPVRDLQDRYRVNVTEVEEKVRDTALWLLYGLENILEVRNFYFHLRTVCEVEPENIKPVELAFKRLSGQIFGLLANLRYRSNLGELIRGIKRVYPKAGRYPGEGTIRRLEEAGISCLGDLVGKKFDDLVGIGIQRNYAELIVSYMQRRMA